MNKKLIILLILLLPFVFGFSNYSNTAHKVYRVYLKGKSIGIIESKKELNEYIDREQKAIKRKYKVDKVYAPTDLKVVEEITYDNELSSTKEIYEKIKDISPFTIKGYKIRIYGTTKAVSDGKKTKTKNQDLYVINKKTFTESAHNTVKSFISEETYNAYANDEQEEIKDTGKIIEKIYLKNKVTIKKQNIPINENIYTSTDELSKYLLFGNDTQESTYSVQTGDTLDQVAFDNKLSVEELLISNPDIQDKDTLLYPGQIIKINSVNPQVEIVEEDYIVKKEESHYQTQTKPDNTRYETYQVIEQEGVNGENKVSQKVQKINGEVVNTVTLSTEVIKEPIKEVVIKGTKKDASSSNSGGVYGNVIPLPGQWGWPASCGSKGSISSGYGYRWGALHDGVDIAGCGYNSAIFAAQSGTVKESSVQSINGNYIVIDHHNGIYTYYGHLCNGCRYVKAGDQVSKGQVIGGMGNTGVAYGVHLHFGFYTGYPIKYGSGGNSTNPLRFY